MASRAKLGARRIETGQDRQPLGPAGFQILSDLLQLVPQIERGLITAAPVFCETAPNETSKLARQLLPQCRH
jgi:hypothetical protein